MENVLFLQSGVADPYAVYAGMLARGPLYYDAGNNIVAVYDYTCCRKILSSAAAAVPAQSTDDGLNETALWVKSRLARASNHPHHAIARKAVADLFCMMQPANARAILPDLPDSSLTGGEVDWVDAVCRKLPVLSVLKSFDFEDDTCTCFLQYLKIAQMQQHLFK